MSGPVVVLGLDSLEPGLAFGDMRPEMPNLSALMDEGVWGPLTSTIPAISCPAWGSMMTGRDPGALGLYGFRNRSSPTYDELHMAQSDDLRLPAVWDICSKHDLKVGVVAVPPGYPAVPVNGDWISCFLTPEGGNGWAYPPQLKDEIQKVTASYRFDVDNFRGGDRDRILAEAYDMAESRWKVINHLLEARRPDFFIACEIGPDRIQHAFWADHDPGHRHHDAASPYQDAIRAFYRFCDGLLGEAITRVPSDATLIVVSDHGARRMEGGICINEWLVRQGYLVLKEPASAPAPLTPSMVDWSKTTAWASGGYYARIFINLAGREADGTVAPSDYEATRQKLKDELEAIPDHEGRPLDTTAYRPEEIYPEREGYPPDLIVYFGDLAWRAIGQVGGGAIHTFENDTGRDHANHAQEGIFVMRDPAGRSGPRQGLGILDVAPTILDALGLPSSDEMTGKVVS
jgi:predicted AlkP superfamily phosphohydrolase/phosphomutase